MNNNPTWNKDGKDTEKAWLRFQERVKGEPVPEVWNQSKPSDSREAQLEISNQRLIHGKGQQVAERPFQTSEDLGMASPSIKGGETTSIYNKLVKKAKYAAALTAACLAVLLFTTEWGDRALAAMVQTFRVQHLAGVNLSEGDITQMQAAIRQGTDDGKSFDLSKYGKVEKQGGGPSVQMTADEAAQATGVPVRLIPGTEAPNPVVTYEPGLKLTLSLHSDAINELITRLGGKSKFPSSIDGKQIVVNLPAVVHSSTSDTTIHAGNKTEEKRKKTLFQLEIPRLDVPEGVDVEQVRQAVLDLPFLPPEVHDMLERTTDWSKTLFIPTLKGTVTNLVLKGHEAVLSSNENMRSLIWLEGERIYELSGPDTIYAKDEMIIADAKEIMKP